MQLTLQARDTVSFTFLFNLRGGSCRCFRRGDNIDEAITDCTCDTRRRLHDIAHADPLVLRAWNIVSGVSGRLTKLDFLEHMFRVGSAVLGLAFVEIAHA